MQQWSGDILEAIGKLPYDLQREIYKSIDIDTRLKVLMYNYPSLEIENQERISENADDIFEWFTDEELAFIYKNGYICKLFYKNSSTRWVLNPSFLAKLPVTRIYGYARNAQSNWNTELQNLTYYHHVFNMIDTLRTHPLQTVKRKINSTLSLLIYTDVYDINFNYYLRKLAYQFIIASNVYKRTCIVARNAYAEQQQQLAIIRENERIEKMALRKIEMEEENRRLQAEREIERQRIMVERQDILRVKLETKQLRIQEREENRRLKQEQASAKIREREEKQQRKQVVLREAEERKQQKAAAKLELDAKRQHKLAMQAAEKENIKRERAEQKAARQQEKNEKRTKKIEENNKRNAILAAKKNERLRIQQEALHNQTLNFICKLFK